jgi:hypothetical protein
MQGEVYHQSATPTVAGYGGKVPTIELIRRELCQHPAGALVETSVRKMARAIGRSAGQLTCHLDQLEADGWIRRLSDHTGTLVEVLRSDQTDDRFDASPAPQPTDPPGPAEAGMAAQSDESAQHIDHADDRPFEASGCDHADDPPACMVDHEIHDQQQQHDARACESTSGLPERRDPERPRQVFPGEWRKIRVANPSYTAADFVEELALASTRPDVRNPVRFVVGLRTRGEGVLSNAEITARQEGAPDGRHNATNRPQRPAAAQKHPRRRGSPQPSHIPAGWAVPAWLDADGG